MQIRNAVLNGPLGFGGAPLGNMFHNISDEEGDTTVDTVWDLGTRYFDTAPFYGAGLSEIRLGRLLAKHKRSDYLLSTKVGRLILDEVETRARDFGEKSGLFEFGRPNKIVYDYSADGTKRSIDDGLKRLGVDHIDFAWVHDVAQDFHGDAWLAQFDIARTGDQTFHGSFWGNNTDLSEVMALAAENKIRHSIKLFTFNEINENLDLLKTGDIVGRAVMRF